MSSSAQIEMFYLVHTHAALIAQTVVKDNNNYCTFNSGGLKKEEVPTCDVSCCRMRDYPATTGSAFSDTNLSACPAYLRGRAAL